MKSVLKLKFNCILCTQEKVIVYQNMKEKNYFFHNKNILRKIKEYILQ
jgi:transcription elongation factor Elf1